MATEELATEGYLDLSICSGTTTCWKDKAYEHTLFGNTILFLSPKLHEQVEVKKNQGQSPPSVNVFIPSCLKHLFWVKF